MNNLTIIDGLIQLPDELTLEKERSVLVYTLNEENKENLTAFCNLWAKGKKTKTGACNDTGISPTTVNRILKYADVGVDYCEQFDIDIMKTNFKHVYKAAKAIKKAQTKASEKLTDIIYAQAEDGNFNAAKFLIQKINPEEFGDQATENSMSGLNNVGNTNNTININLMAMNDKNIESMESAQERLFKHAHKMRNDDIKAKELKRLQRDE